MIGVVAFADAILCLSVGCDLVLVCCVHAFAQANRSYGMDFPDIKSCFPLAKDKQTHA